MVTDLGEDSHAARNHEQIVVVIPLTHGAAYELVVEPRHLLPGVTVIT